LGSATQWQIESARAQAFLEEFRETLKSLRKKTPGQTPAASTDRR
jgi:hypothetical protein